MKFKLLLVIFLLIGFSSFTQEIEEPKYKIPNVLRSVEPYGSVRFAFGGNENGTGVVDHSTRVGVKGEWDFSEGSDYYFFMNAEVGINLSRKNDFVDISSDPGAPYGKANNAVFARVGLIGIGSPYGNISLGKQWSVHYAAIGDVDTMYLFGGDAIGVYNAGTDGGSSGTGRADNAVKYVFSKDNFYLGLQGQFRNISENNEKFADTYGIASYYKLNTFKIGASFNKVLDGVIDPTHGEAAIDDEIFSALLAYSFSDFDFSITASTFNNHEITDEGMYYEGWGLEYHFKYNFGKNKEWSVIHNTSLLKPDDSENTEYVFNRYAFELARRFSKNTLIVAGFRFDNNKLSNGQSSDLHTLAIGFYYNFNSPLQ
ncbi:MAG: porin [Bacteroidota bacterium]